MKSFLSELQLYVCNHIVTNIPFHFVRLAFYRHVMGFQLASGVAVHLGVRFNSKNGLKIGINSAINVNCRLDTRGGITIGDNVAISPETTIITADHDVNTCNFKGRSRPVIIEDYVYIGTRAMILPSVTVHRGSVVAAGAVVSRDVRALDIVGGVPARPIGRRNSELSYTTKYSRLFH